MGVDVRRASLVIATAVALVALVGMHGLPLVATSTVGQQSVHATASLVTSHDHDGMPAPQDGIALARTASDHAPGPHSHSLVHLCLAVLLGALSVLVLVLRRGTVLGVRAPTSSLRVRSLVPRAVGPPSLSELCLLRC